MTAVLVERLCANCGVSIEHRSARAKTCSQRCNMAVWRVANPERAGEQARRSMATWRKNNPDAAKARSLAQRQRTREHCRQKSMEWRRANPERSRAGAQSWAARNRNKRKLHNDARRARMLQNGVFVVTLQDWDRIIARYRGCCAYCGEPSTELQREHVIPLARGGRHSVGNIVPACATCNSTKRHRFVMEWRVAERRGRR